MALRDVVIQTSVVEASPGSFFEVRGLNLYDITKLLISYAPAMMALFNKAKDSIGDGQKMTESLVKDLMMQAVHEAPDLVFAAIVEAAEEPGTLDIVRRLPLVVQLEAIEQIVLLSIRSETELKKLQEIILTLLEAMTGTFLSLNSPSSAGSGA